MRIPIYVLGFGFVLSIGALTAQTAQAANHASEPEHSGYPGRGWRPEQGRNSGTANYDCAFTHGRGGRGRKFQHRADAGRARFCRRRKRDDRL